MNKLPLLLISIICLASCSSDNDQVNEMFSADQFPQKWTLVEMTGNIPNVAPKTGADMSWQEYYVFNADKTFIKVRDVDGVKSEAAGTYDSATYSSEKYLELIFSSGENLVAHCGSGPVETLYAVSESEIASTWLQCDGPGLKYRRLEY